MARGDAARTALVETNIQQIEEVRRGPGRRMGSRGFKRHRISGFTSAGGSVRLEEA
jgi:hypothetical protein